MDSAGRNIFLYFAYFAAFGSCFLFARSFMSHAKAPSPELARRALRTASVFTFALGVPFGILGVGESLAWFADDPIKKLIFMVGVMAAEAVIIWRYLRAMRPIADELKQIKKKGAT